MESVSNSYFLERLNNLFGNLELEITSVTPIRNKNSRVNLSYNKGENLSLFILEFSPSCLEVYGAEDVPSELINTITQAISGAQYQQYNPRTHYWSGKVIDDYMKIARKPLTLVNG